MSEYRLEQNYPNPFNPVTRFSYAIPEEAYVHLRIFNTLGQEVALLVNAIQSPGWKSVEFDGSTLPSGIYFYQLDAGKFRSIKKFVLMK